MRTVGLGALVLAGPATAEVTAVTPTSFVIEQSVTVAAAPPQLWEKLRAPQKWWDPEHSYSGDSANLYLDAQAAGCFCERTPKDKGSVEHARVVYVAPGRMIRLVGALGPLQAEAVTGTLTWRVDPVDATTSKLSLSYVVGGHMRQGGEVMAPLVDKVLLNQLTRLKAAAEAGMAPAK
ncbi:Polyketide cyclase / dehydrase and lipid transport [Sphingomonas guangdongensis]|uniref:Polyketide cyclase / dehydrase and lipid transport n=1 Tax=Sphingomonas guangdongensis TaxID=1141890 RepID=A0A285R188_9SPHN|nr:SRPBCC family protein [Sphingomonas guangdongensis]SOB87489.1 Polyketide cyclase / dehydrase and lipid transport [Sphingomonas guangdongensis]